MERLEHEHGGKLSRTVKPPIPDKQVIHRSRKTRAAFFDAASQADYVAATYGVDV